MCSTATGRAGQGRAGQGRAGQGRAGQGRAGQARAGQDRARVGAGKGKRNAQVSSKAAVAGQKQHKVGHNTI